MNEIFMGIFIGLAIACLIALVLYVYFIVSLM